MILYTWYRVNQIKPKFTQHDIHNSDNSWSYQNSTIVEYRTSIDWLIYCQFDKFIAMLIVVFFLIWIVCLTSIVNSRCFILYVVMYECRKYFPTHQGQGPAQGPPPAQGPTPQAVQPNIIFNFYSLHRDQVLLRARHLLKAHLLKHGDSNSNNKVRTRLAPTHRDLIIHLNRHHHRKLSWWIINSNSNNNKHRRRHLLLLCNKDSRCFIPSDLLLFIPSDTWYMHET